MKIRKAFQGTVPANKILNTQTTSDTDTYSCGYIEEHFVRDSFVVLRRKSDWTWNVSDVNAKVQFPFDLVYAQNGSSLEPNGTTGVKVKRGVKFVRVKVLVFKNETSQTGGSQWLMGYIRKNNTIQSRSVIYLDYWHFLSSELILPVSENDIIDFAVQCGRTGNLLFPTYDSFGSCQGMSVMIVEAVA